MSGVFGDRHSPQDIEFVTGNEMPVTMILRLVFRDVAGARWMTGT